MCACCAVIILQTETVRFCPVTKITIFGACQHQPTPLYAEPFESSAQRDVVSGAVVSRGRSEMRVIGLEYMQVLHIAV